MVEPVHVLEGGVLDLVPVPPWSHRADEFCLVQADDGLREGVVAGSLRLIRPTVRCRLPPAACCSGWTGIGRIQLVVATLGDEGGLR